jgi:hypothetical protein
MRIFVIAQRYEPRVAQMISLGPFREFDLSDELWA